MKKLLTRLTAALLVCIMALTVVPESGLQVQAAVPKVSKRIDAILYPNDTGSFYVNIQNSTSKGKITSLEVSDPEIAKVTVSTDKKYLTYTPKNIGNTTVSFKYAGRKLSTKIYVVKWENPCKKFLLDSKDLKKNFDKSGHYDQATKSKKDVMKKIKVEAASGWKILGIYRLDNDGRKKVKNNSKVKLSISGTGTGIGVVFQNKKTKKNELLYYGYGSWGAGNTYDSRETIESNIHVFTGK